MTPREQVSAIKSEAAHIAALRTEMNEELDGLAATDERFYRVTQPECTCDRDPLGVCPRCGGWSDNVIDAAEYALAVGVWNAALADCLAELATPLGPHCADCKTTSNLRDSDTCWPCYDKRRADAEAFARFGGDV